MSKVSRETASKVNDMGVAEDRTEEFDGYTVNFVAIRQDADLAPMLKGLPDDRCQCPHWGYVFKGQMTVSYADHEDVIGPGDAFYMPPGHTPSALAGTEFVQIQSYRRVGCFRSRDGKEHAGDATQTVTNESLGGGRICRRFMAPP